MFDIEYKGGNTVTVATKKTTVVIDPKRSVNGQKDVVVAGAVEVATESRFALNSADAKLSIEGPGEYEVGDVAIRGIPATRHLDTDADEQISTIYRLEVGDSRIAVIGNITPKVTEEQLEAVGVVDILIIPVGGNGYTLDAESAALIARQIGPKAIIPVHYADETLKYEVPQDDLERFVKELALPVEEPGVKYKIKSSATLPATVSIVRIDRS